MDVLWGVVLLVVCGFCWLGQLISWVASPVAVRLGLCEAETDVEPAFWADGRGEAAWDSFTLWTLPVAGLLLLWDLDSWAYLGLCGGGMYVYFAGRGVLARLAMQRRGLRIGSPASVRIGYVALVVWGTIALVTIAAAVAVLGTE